MNFIRICEMIAKYRTLLCIAYAQTNKYVRILWCMIKMKEKIIIKKNQVYVCCIFKDINSISRNLNNRVDVDLVSIYISLHLISSFIFIKEYYY